MKENKENKKQQMYKCEICGRESFKKIRLGGYTLCSKHMHQLFKYGRFLDNNPRTNSDLNDYYIKNDIAYFNVYNQKNEYIETFMIDLEDIEKVKYHKWRMSHGHVCTGLPSKGTQQDLAHVVLGITKQDLENNMVIDHIDGNPLNNTKSNLRYCRQGENVLNKSFMSTNTSGFIGVTYAKHREKWDPAIRKEEKRCHLGYYEGFIDAVYARYIAEELIFKDFKNEEEHEKKRLFTESISPKNKDYIYKRTVAKLKSKGLLKE